MQPAAKHSGGSFNVNVGLLGHIDCGKTSLGKFFRLCPFSFSLGVCACESEVPIAILYLFMAKFRGLFISCRPLLIRLLAPLLRSLPSGMLGNAKILGAGLIFKQGELTCVTFAAKALSTHLSTAAIDKHPQSQERGITLDLGFSSFTEEAPERVKLSTGCDRLRFTLVDCPGHASLIRTVLGGAQIIDMMLLVVDAKEGIQTQTAECIVVGEILGPDLVIVLNKCDLLESQEEVEEAKRKLRKALKRTAFAESPMIAVSAAPSCEPSASTGISELISEVCKHRIFFLWPFSASDHISRAFGVQMVARAPADKRDTSGKFLFAADHCFAVKGQGTVLTGTILRGQVEVGNQVEVPALKAVRKVKSLQMFKEPAKRAVKGDRVALCLPQVDAGAIERGFVAAPESIKPLKGCVASAVKVRYYKASVQTGAKFHVTIGHATVLATVTFFCEPRNERPERAHRVSQLGHAERADNFDSDLAYLLCGELSPEGEERSQSGDEQGPQQEQGPQFCLLTFGQPVICDPHALYIASKLDTDTDARACRCAPSCVRRHVRGVP